MKRLRRKIHLVTSELATTDHDSADIKIKVCKILLSEL